MPRRLTSRRKPIDHARRRATAQRRAGLDARCACGEDRPQALIAGTTPITCQECARVQQGKTPFDKHHIAGDANDPTTITVPRNDHAAILTEGQHDWPAQTHENPDGDPCLRGAACVRGFRDTVHYVIDRVLLWIAEFLEHLSAYLVNMHGRFYWRGTPLEQFAPKREA